MTTYVAWAAALAGLLAGPLSVKVTERAVGRSLLPSRRPRTAVVLAVSIAVGVLFLIGGLRFGLTPLLLVWCWACLLGCSLALADLRSRRLPFLLVGALVAGGFGAFFIAAVIGGSWNQLAFACSAAIAVFLLAGLVQVAFPDHAGGGDTALYGAVALYLGWFGWDGLIRGLLVASGLTAVVALGVAMFSGRTKMRFPAGPPLLAGTLVGFLIA